jgi:hypothetical protein
MGKRQRKQAQNDDERDVSTSRHTQAMVAAPMPLLPRSTAIGSMRSTNFQRRVALEMVAYINRYGITELAARVRTVHSNWTNHTFLTISALCPCGCVVCCVLCVVCCVTRHKLAHIFRNRQKPDIPRQLRASLPVDSKMCRKWSCQVPRRVRRIGRVGRRTSDAGQSHRRVMATILGG